MKKISKRVREEAALICAVDASLGEPMMYWDIRDALGVSNDAATLAADALVAASDLYGHGGPPEGRFWSRWYAAEAEAMLRTGWTP